MYFLGIIRLKYPHENSLLSLALFSRESSLGSMNFSVVLTKSREILFALKIETNTCRLLSNQHYTHMLLFIMGAREIFLYEGQDLCKINLIEACNLLVRGDQGSTETFKFQTQFLVMPILLLPSFFPFF